MPKFSASALSCVNSRFEKCVPGERAVYQAVNESGGPNRREERGGKERGGQMVEIWCVRRQCVKMRDVCLCEAGNGK